jgi:hypothetical protein
MDWTDILFTESMNTNVPVRVTTDDYTVFETLFTVAGHQYMFSAVRGRKDSEISFHRKVKNPDMLGGTDSEWDVTNDLSLKDTLKVFAGVKSSLDKWVKREREARRDLIFYFTSKADEASRMKLYDKFAKLLSKKMGLHLQKGSWYNEIRYDFQDA